MLTLLASQNRDGGWPYRPGGPSWTEPTAYALLALLACGAAAEPLEWALRWLRAAQRPDGGWPPQPAVAESTWVTAVATLLGPAALGEPPYRRAIAWLMAQSGRETGWLSRLRLFLLGNPPSAEHRLAGWPWYPGTSAWVTPTALTMLALRKTLRWENVPPVHARLEMGSSFLLAHACSDGGWNYGAERVLSYDADSYPETTGVALLALHGSASRQIPKACKLARAYLPVCQTSEAESWLRLGLLAHQQLPPDIAPPMRPQRTVLHAALALLARAAQQGRNIFLE